MCVNGAACCYAREVRILWEEVGNIRYAVIVLVGGTAQTLITKLGWATTTTVATASIRATRLAITVGLAAETVEADRRLVAMAATPPTTIRTTVKVVTVRGAANPVPADLQPPTLAAVGTAAIRATILALALRLAHRHLGFDAAIIRVWDNSILSPDLFCHPLVGCREVGIVMNRLRAARDWQHGNYERA